MKGGEGQMLKGQPVTIRGRRGVIESDEPTTENTVKVRFGDAVVWIDLGLLQPAGIPPHSPDAEAVL